MSRKFSRFNAGSGGPSKRESRCRRFAVRSRYGFAPTSSSCGSMENTDGRAGTAAKNSRSYVGSNSVTKSSSCMMEASDKFLCYIEFGINSACRGIDPRKLMFIGPSLLKSKITLAWRRWGTSFLNDIEILRGRQCEPTLLLCRCNRLPTWGRTELNKTPTVIVLAEHTATFGYRVQ